MNPTIILIVCAVIVVFAIATYNRLVTLRQRTKNAWAQIDVQLKRRYDLIPNLVETCKGYMKHEREVLESVTKARQQAIDATGVAEQAVAEGGLTRALRSLMMVAEAYPDLKANQNMLGLQEELTSTENKIAFARQFYNDCVMEYNASIERIPASLFADTCGFKAAEMFELVEAAQREAPKVAF